MKTACHLALATLLYTVAVTGAKADADASSNDPAAPYRIPTDPDGVPLSVTQPKDQQPTQAELDAEKKQQQKEADDKDWLVRGYQEQMRQRADANTISSDANKSLTQAPTTAPTINPNQHRQGTLSSSVAKDLFIPTGVTDPLNAPSPYKPLSFGAPQAFFPSPITGTGQKSAVKSSPASQDKAQDPLAFQTPGQIAAEQNPNLYPAGVDPNVETLPGETVEQAQQRLISSPVAELSMPLEVKQPPRALPVGVLATTGSTTTTKKMTPLAPVPIIDLNAPTPVNKLPVQSPVRSPIGNPYDIFYR